MTVGVFLYGVECLALTCFAIGFGQKVYHMTTCMSNDSEIVLYHGKDGDHLSYATDILQSSLALKPNILSFCCLVLYHMFIVVNQLVLFCL